MKLCKITALALAQLGFLVTVTIQDDMCGMPAPDPAKTCISLRLPWNPTPMYFCTDKSKFRYRNQCQNRFANTCNTLATTRQDVLMVADPWSCCPMVSYPDSCANQQCPPAPLNRKCQTMEPNPNQPWECCNSYFCEENMTPETCHFKRLEPSCNMPPPEKKNCIAFVDPYGCCPKFQCEGEGKPGHCPAEMEAMKLMARFNSTNMYLMGQMRPGMPLMMQPGMGMNAAVSIGSPGSGSPAAQAEMNMENKPGGGAPPAPETPPAPAPAPAPEAPPAPDSAPPPAPDAPPAERQGGFGGRPLANMGSPVSSFVAIPGGNQQNMIACVSDDNCPTNMKCCSHDLNVYIMDGRFLFRNSNPTYGYCMEPMMNSVGTKTIKYVSQ